LLILRARKVELFYLQKWHLNRAAGSSLLTIFEGKIAQLCALIKSTIFIVGISNFGIGHFKRYISKLCRKIFRFIGTLTHGVSFSSLGVIFKEINCLSKTAKFLGGKNPKELIHSL